MPRETFSSDGEEKEPRKILFEFTWLTKLTHTKFKLKGKHGVFIFPIQNCLHKSRTSVECEIWFVAIKLLNQELYFFPT